MNFIIAGGTGFVGKQLTNHLVNKGHHVYILTRSPEEKANTERQHYISYDVNPAHLPKIKGIVNLAGDSLFGHWTDQKKERIVNSRLDITKRLISIMKKLEEKPEVFISGSAVGYYGTSEEMIFTEKTEKAGQDFLGLVTKQWEETASKAENLSNRTIYTRFGVILGKNEGSFPLMALPVKLFVGGRIGDGEQWISWVHINDVVKILDQCLFDERLSGPVNITAPNPVQNKIFYKRLTQVMNRPYWFPTPKLLFKAALGEMSQLITKGQYVKPQKVLDTEYTFEYPTVQEAFNDLLTD